jgi:hypothetical protein
MVELMADMVLVPSWRCRVSRQSWDPIAAPGQRESGIPTILCGEKVVGRMEIRPWRARAQLVSLRPLD